MPPPPMAPSRGPVARLGPRQQEDSDSRRGPKRRFQGGAGVAAQSGAALEHQVGVCCSLRRLANRRDSQFREIPLVRRQPSQRLLDFVRRQVQAALKRLLLDELRGGRASRDQIAAAARSEADLSDRVALDTHRAFDHRRRAVEIGAAGGGGVLDGSRIAGTIEVVEHLGRP